MSDINQADLYRIMDRAGLDVGTLLNSRKSMSKIVSEIRVKLADEITNYVKKREEEQ